MRIELTEVEHQLSSFPGVKQALVVVHTDTIQQQHLVGYLSPDTINTEQLRQHVAKFLPKQMIPETFVLLDQFPKMPNGKADRASLPEPKYSDMAKADYAAPSSEMQEAVRFCARAAYGCCRWQGNPYLPQYVADNAIDGACQHCPFPSCLPVQLFLLQAGHSHATSSL